MKNRTLTPQDAPNFRTETIDAFHKLGGLRENRTVGGNVCQADAVFASGSIRKVLRHASLLAEYTGDGKTLAKAGVWLVPPDRRPKGWEKLGLRERGE